MEKKKYTVLLGQGDKINENYKFNNINIAKAIASAFTLDSKYDTVALQDNETGKFIHFDPKSDLTEEQTKQEAIVINVKEIKDKLFTIIDAGYLNALDDWYEELQRDVAEASIKRNYWDFNELGADGWKALKERYNKTNQLDALVEYVLENYEDPCEYVSDIFVEIEEVDTDGCYRGYANVSFNGMNDITYSRYFDSSVEELDTIIDEYNLKEC